MGTEAQKRACRNYYMRTKNSHRVYLLRFKKDSDADVIEALDSCGNKTDFVRSLIRGAAKRQRKPE